MFIGGVILHHRAPAYNRHRRRVTTVVAIVITTTTVAAIVITTVAAITPLLVIPAAPFSSFPQSLSGKKTPGAFFRDALASPKGEYQGRYEQSLFFFRTITPA
ncbi:MAG: hypothetical protein ACR2P7_07930 [bacterium]